MRALDSSKKTSTSPISARPDCNMHPKISTHLCHNNQLSPLVDEGHELVDALNDAPLLGQWRNGNREVRDIAKVDLKSMRSPAHLDVPYPIGAMWRIDAGYNPGGYATFDRSQQTEAHEDAKVEININDNGLTQSADSAKQNIAILGSNSFAELLVVFFTNVFHLRQVEISF